MKEKLIVSACLLGKNCKYNGTNNKNEKVLSLAEKYDIVPVCPECFGRLPVPRAPSEIKNGGVFSKDGKDVTEFFKAGAEKALEAAKKSGAAKAVLKARSPSCGKGRIYDGSFTGRVIDGDGITAALFKKNGISVFTEDETEELF